MSCSVNPPVNDGGSRPDYTTCALKWWTEFYQKLADFLLVNFYCYMKQILQSMSGYFC